MVSAEVIRVIKGVASLSNTSFYKNESPLVIFKNTFTAPSSTELDACFSLLSNKFIISKFKFLSGGVKFATNSNIIL